MFKKFIDERVLPRDVAWLGMGFRQALPELLALRQAVREAGLWAPHMPREYGGLGLSLTDLVPVSEALGRSPYGHFLFNCQAPDIGNMELMLSHGSDMQKGRYLQPLARGEVRSCFAMTEPQHAGSNPTWLDTLARRDGEEWVVTGHKWFTSSADGAAFTIVMAVTSPDAEPHRRASMIIVPLDTPGFERVRNIPVMGEAGEDYFSHAEVRFNECRVPLDHLLGGEGEGFKLAQERLGPGRIHHCMRWIGICERAFELMCGRAATRELSPGVMLGSQQTVENWIAECRAEIDAARLLVTEAARQVEARGTRGARVEISLIKFHVAGVMMRVLDKAIQVHGAYGLTSATPLEWWYRHERGARIYDGPDEVHKSVVARHILRSYSG